MSRTARNARLVCIGTSGVPMAAPSMEISLTAGEEQIIGRGAAATFRIETEHLSRKHARVFSREGTWHIEDLQSTNGVVVNGARVAETALAEGDEVALGPISFRLELVASAPARPAAAAAAASAASATPTAAAAGAGPAAGGKGALTAVVAGVVVLALAGIGYLWQQSEPAPKSEPPAVPAAAPQAESEASRKAEEQARVQAEAEARRLAEAAAERQAALEARQKAEEQARLQAEAEAKRLAEETARQQAALAAESKAVEQAKAQAEAEARRKAELAAQKQAALEAQRKAEEQARIQLEAEAKRKAEEAAQQQAALEAKRKAEEQARIQAEAEEAKRKAEQAALEAKRKAEEQARVQAEAEAKRKAEQAALEAKRRLEEQARLRAEAEAEAKRQAGEAARKQAAQAAAASAAAATAAATASTSAAPAPAAAPIAASSSAAAGSMSGRQILDEVANRHDRPYEFEIQSMSLIDRSGNTETREMRRYLREVAKNEKRLVSVFHSPSGVKGVALLTWQHADKPDDQWLFLPAQGNRMKRIAEGGQKNYFMGTDYTFEDLVTESRDKFKYERLPDETIDGGLHFVVRAVASDPELQKETGYAYRTLWIRQDNFVITRVDFFDRRERLIKRQTNEGFEQIEGQTWRPRKSVLEHLKNEHKTVVEVTKRSFDEADVPESNFQQRTIETGRILR